jgi:phosphoglycerol transferase MdoB-like AlkP superfamily enzyme
MINNKIKSLIKKIQSLVPLQFQYILGVYIIGILLFTIFRLIIFIMHCLVSSSDVTFYLTSNAFIMGLRFDTTVSCYFLVLLILGMIIGSLFNINKKYYYLTFHYIIIVFYAIAFLICSADIPYFNYFFNRFNIVALTWVDSPKFVINMIIKEPSYIIYSVVFLAFLVGYIFIMHYLYMATIKKVINNERQNKFVLKTTIISILFIGLCFIGIRGRFAEKSPIRVGTAYFSNNAFFNQLGLNPVFTFFKSYLESTSSKNKVVHLIDETTAKKIVEEEFSHRDDSTSSSIFLPKNTNVVVVIMESMAASKVGHFGNIDNMTPNLDSILNHSLSFENIYTAGIHTYNGVFSTLFAYPAILSHHSMKQTIIPKMNGLPNVLKDNGYNTYYFTTHDEQFDNVAGFLYGNDIEKIISQKDYPRKEIKSTLGVPDHIMFKRVVKTLNERKNNKPFFAAIMTASDHGPYIYPDNIPLRPHQKDIKKKMVEYADWAIGQFINEAKRASWFNNTLFVFVADHGAADPLAIYDIQLPYHHSPLAFYYPKAIPAQKNYKIGLQIDIAPTILSMLNKNYKNNTMGINLLGKKRAYGYFSSDDKIGVIDSTFLYIWRENGGEGLYKYTKNDRNNYIKQYPQKAKLMKTYGFSMIQYSQHNILQKQKQRNK